MVSNHVKITRWHDPEHPEFYVDVVKTGRGRCAWYEAWLGRSDYGVSDMMFGLRASSMAEFLELVEVNLPEYIETWELEHVGQ